MEPFYLSHEEFWDWFNRDPSQDEELVTKLNQKMNIMGQISCRSSGPRPPTEPYSIISAKYHSNADVPEAKRMKTGPNNKMKSIRHISETDASVRCDARYIIMYGKHRPGKKTKVWEGDGYLTLVNGVAHISDLKGRMLETPSLLDEVDLSTIKDLGEVLVGDTEVQVVELDK